MMVSSLLKQRRATVDTWQLHLKNRTETWLAEQNRFIQLTEQFVKMASPEYLLKRGYSLTLKEGKIVKQASDLQSGDEIVTRFSDGEIHASVTQVQLSAEEIKDKS